MNLLFTICGRAGSKGIKNKNIRDFCEYPLLFYSLSIIDLIKKEKKDWNIDVVINSDSAELLELGKNNPFFPLNRIERSPQLGLDNIGKIEVIKDCYFQMKNKLEKEFDMVIDLDLTSPLRTKDDLMNVIEKHSETQADVTTTVTDSRRNPYFNMVKRTDHGYKKVLDSNFVTRQEAPQMFDMNASIYAYNPSFLLEDKGVLDGYCECVKMYDTGILDLDHESDFELMEIIADYLFKNKNTFYVVKENIIRSIRRL